MGFYEVAKVAVGLLVSQLDYRSGMDWREVTEEWVGRQLKRIEEQVAVSVGEEKLW